MGAPHRLFSHPLKTSFSMIKRSGWFSALRLTSASLAFLFSAQTLLSAAPAYPVLGKGYFPELSIPESFGTVESVFKPKSPSGKPFVIHIQDAHAQPAAQRNIRNLLQYLHDKHQVRHVAVEAGHGNLEPGRLNLFPSAEINPQLADYLIDRGEITAGEHCAASHAGSRVSGTEVAAVDRESSQIFKNP